MQKSQHQKSLILLFIANGISGFAQGVSMLAIPWYFAKNNESQVFNYSYAAITFMVMFFGLYAGTLVDKYSRKYNFLFTSLVCGVFIASIALFGYQNNGLPSLLVISVFAITMLNYNIHYPTLYAFAQEISDAKEYKTVNSNIEIVGQSTSILSGAFAAMLLDGFSFKVFGFNFNVDSWKIYDVFLMDAITYFMAAGLIFYIPYKQNLQKKVIDSSVFIRLKIGFGYLMKNRNILVFGIFSYMVFAMLLVQIHAVLPAYIKLHLQAKGSSFAIADTIYAVGALCSGFFISKLFKKISLANIIISLTFVVSLIFLWAAVSKSVLVIYIVSLILGFCNAGIRILRLTYLFNHVPNELMGRVGSIFNLINVLTRSIFIYLFSFGFFTINSNMVYCYGIMSAFLMFSAITLLLNEKTVSKSKKAILS